MLNGVAHTTIVRRLVRSGSGDEGPAPRGECEFELVGKPPLVTTESVRHAFDNRWYPEARDDLVVRALTCALVIVAGLLAYFTAMSYWQTRPVRNAVRRERQLTH